VTLPVVADLPRLLRGLAREEETERRGLARLEARVRRYEDVESPAYQAWLRLAHGPLVTRIDELAAELRARQMLAERVTELVEDEGLHPREALWVVREAKPTRAARSDDAPKPDEIAARRRAKLERKRAARRHAKRERKHGGDTRTSATPPTEETSRRRLLGLYRALARSLHPDSPTVVRTLATERLRAVWSEVQAAYAVRSLERLLALATWLETVRAAGDDATAAASPDGSFLSLAERHERLRALRRAARALERKLADLTREPAWEFAEASPAERRKLDRVAARRLTGERDAMAAALAAVDAFLDGIGPARPPRAVRRH
jgi:hypothetical protein